MTKADDLARAITTAVEGLNDLILECFRAKVWLDDGHESLGSWWQGMVYPKIKKCKYVSVILAPEIKDLIDDMIDEEEAELPVAQRTTREERAAMLGETARAHRARSTKRNQFRNVDQEEEDRVNGDYPLAPVLRPAFPSEDDIDEDVEFAEYEGCPVSTFASKKKGLRAVLNTYREGAKLGAYSRKQAFELIKELNDAATYIERKYK